MHTAQRDAMNKFMKQFDFMKQFGYKLVRIEKSNSKSKAGKSKADKSKKDKKKNKTGKARLVDLMTKGMRLSVLDASGKDVPAKTPSDKVKKMMMRDTDIISAKKMEESLSKEDLMDLCRKMPVPVSGSKIELAKKLLHACK